MLTRHPKKETTLNNEPITLPEGVPPLNTYYFYLTTGCNLACQHCWLAPQYQPDGGTGGHLSFDLFKLAIEEGLPLGLSRVKLTGGEPLLHPDFVRMIDFLKEKKLGVTIETNGTLMTPQLASQLRGSGVVSDISVSIDGATAKTHDAFRGVKGSFDKACQGMDYLVAAGFRPQIIMSLHTGNVDEIEAEIKLAEKLGAASLKFNIVQPSGRGETMTRRNQVLDIKRLVELGCRIETELQKNTQVRLFFSHPMAFFNLKRLLDHPSDSCGIFSILGILSTGQLAMCGIGIEIPELVYGKLGVERIADVWYHHPMLLALRRDLPEKLEGICGDCMFRPQCLGGCVAENYHQAKRLTAPFWFCQQALEAGLFPVSRIRMLAAVEK